MTPLSDFLCTRTKMIHCLSFTVLMIGYAVLIIGGKSKCFENQLPAGSSVLGLTFGYSQDEVIALFSAFDNAGIECYKWINLYPLLPMAHDWLKNRFELGLLNNFITNSTAGIDQVSIASTITQAKWISSSLSYFIILVGIGLHIGIALKTCSTSFGTFTRP